MNFRHVSLSVGLLFALAGGAPCLAESQPQVQISFPLQGYYRPGKYMPVRVRTDAATAAPVVLRAEGVVNVSVGPGSAAIDAVVPWLAADVVRSPRWEIEGADGGAVDVTFTAIEPRQVLVGVVSANMAAATTTVSDLFPGKSVVALALAESPPLPGVPAAWEAFDAVVFDAPDYPLFAELLAEGVSVVVRSDASPGGRWAWQGGPGRWWVSFEVAGPRGAIHPEIYEPISAWRPGWPAPLRWRAVLWALVYCLVALAMTLWLRTLLAVLAVVIISFVAAAGFAWRGSRQSMVSEVTARVSISGIAGTQTDAWTYVRALRPREVVVDWSWRQKPVFASARHLRETDVRLDVGASGRPLRMTWRAAPGTTLAFLRRGFDPTGADADSASPAPPRSPTRELVLQSYLAPGDVVLDDGGVHSLSDDADWTVSWPSVTLRRATAPVTSGPAAGTRPAGPPE